MYKGSLFLLKVGDGGTPVENFATVGGMLTTGITLNNRTVESTNIKSGQWREILGNAGITSMNISGSGVFTDDDALLAVASYALNNDVYNYQIHFSSGLCVQGPFQITSYSDSGNNDNEEAYSVSLASAGPVEFC